MRKLILSEKNLVIILFVLVFIVFSFAQEYTKRIEKMYLQVNSSATSFDKPDDSYIIVQKEGNKVLNPPAQVR